MQKCRRHCASNRESVVIIRRFMVCRVCCLLASLLWGLWPTAVGAQSKAVWQLSVSDTSQTSLVQLGLPEGDTSTLESGSLESSSLESSSLESERAP